MAGKHTDHAQRAFGKEYEALSRRQERWKELIEQQQMQLLQQLTARRGAAPA